MDTKDKKPGTLLKEMLYNLTQPTGPATNIREVDFKKDHDDVVQTIGADTEAILITYERDKGEMKLFHNGEEIDKAVFAKKLRAETGFFAIFDYIQDKFKSWRTAWM